MKRLIAVISSLLVLPAFAEVAPAYYYEETVEYSDEYSEPSVEQKESETAEQEEQKQVAVPVVPTAVSPRNTTGRAAASRAVATSTTSNRTVSSRNTTPARAVTARTATTTTPSRVSRTNTASGTTTVVSSRPSTTVRSATTQTKGVTTRASSQNNNANTARASIVQTDTATTPLYISGRVGVNTASVSARVPTLSANTTSSTTTATTTSATTTAASMDELAQLTDFCKAQYTACMDNFCNVLDDNQGRCSCSANLKNYAETENALKKATEELQDVSVQINYLLKDLSADQIESLYTQTEAELALQGTSDTSAIKNDLDSIKDMLVQVQSGKASSSSLSSGLSIDLSSMLNIDLSGSMFNLDSLLGTNTANTSSISNQRGEQLYKTASARCKASVLNSCAAQGVDISIISNSYDLEIDKQCLAYERNLTDANEEMYNKVTTAKYVLQLARLQSALNKNSNNLRECISELDNCMQDDFVCGNGYENCLDPSGKYIINGEIIVGSKPGVSGGITEQDTTKFAEGLYETWNFDDSAAWVGGVSVSDYIDQTIATTTPSSTSKTMSEYLQNKIGYHDTASNKDFGMCMSVLNTCQDLTYTSANNQYQYDNKVIREYLQQVLVQIKAKQDTILSDYAEDCITEVTKCLTQNNYDPDDNTKEEATDETKMSTKNKLAMRACNAMITTCMSVNGVDNDLSTETIGAEEWISEIMK